MMVAGDNDGGGGGGDGRKARPRGIPPELEKEFDAGVLALVSQLRTIEPNYPNLVADLKAGVQDLCTVFTQVIDRAHDTVQQMLKFEAVEVHLRNEVAMHQEYRQKSQERMEAQLARLEELVPRLESQHTATSASVSELAAEIKTLRTSLEDNAAWQQKFHGVGQENADLHEQVTELKEAKRNMELRNHSLKQELTGRIQQLQLMSKGMATQDNAVYARLLSELEHNTMKAIANAASRRASAAVGSSSHSAAASTAAATPAAAASAPATQGATADPNGTSVHNPRAIKTHEAVKREVQLTRGRHGLGFMIMGGAPAEAPEKFEPVLVRQVYPDQPAAKSGKVFQGDRVLAINGHALDGLLHSAIVKLIKEQDDKVVLTLLSHYRFPEEDDKEEALSPEEELVHELLRKGNACIRASNHDMAIQFYSQAIESAPNNIVAYTNRAAAYLQMNQWEKALSDCNAAIRISPSYALAYNRLGCACEGLDDFQSARDAHAKACQLDPNNKEYRENLGQAEARIAEASASASNTGPQERPPQNTGSAAAKAVDTVWDRVTSEEPSREVSDAETASSDSDQRQPRKGKGKPTMTSDATLEETRRSFNVQIANVQQQEPQTTDTALFATF